MVSTRSSQRLRSSKRTTSKRNLTSSQSDHDYCDVINPSDCTPPTSPSTLHGNHTIMGHRSLDGQDTVQSSEQERNNQQRELLRPWLIRQINSGEIDGLYWMDKEGMVVRVPWTHGSRHGFDVDRDSNLFKRWAVKTGKYNRDGKNSPKRWKANFRCAMNSLTDMEELKKQSKTRGTNAYKVYKFLSSKRTSGRALASLKRRQQEGAEPAHPLDNSNHKDVLLQLKSKVLQRRNTPTITPPGPPASRRRYISDSEDSVTSTDSGLSSGFETGSPSPQSSRTRLISDKSTGSDSCAESFYSNSPTYEFTASSIAQTIGDGCGAGSEELTVMFASYNSGGRDYTDVDTTTAAVTTVTQEVDLAPSFGDDVVEQYTSSQNSDFLSAPLPACLDEYLDQDVSDMSRHHAIEPITDVFRQIQNKKQYSVQALSTSQTPTSLFQSLDSTVRNCSVSDICINAEYMTSNCVTTQYMSTDNCINAEYGPNDNCLSSEYGSSENCVNAEFGSFNEAAVAVEYLPSVTYSQFTSQHHDTELGFSAL